MLNEQILDLRGLYNPVNIKVGNYVRITICEGDSQLKIKLNIDEAEKFYESYREEIGELTTEEMEDMILNLKSKIETLENDIEYQKQVIDNLLEY